MIITENFIKGMIFWEEYKYLCPNELRKIIKQGIKKKDQNLLRLCNEIIIKLLWKGECIQYALFLSDQILNISKNPEKIILRKTLKGTKRYLKNRIFDHEYYECIKECSKLDEPNNILRRKRHAARAIYYIGIIGDLKNYDTYGRIYTENAIFYCISAIAYENEKLQTKIWIRIIKHGMKLLKI